MKPFYGALSPLTAIVGLLVAAAEPLNGIPLLLAAILFHMWSVEKKE